jgi:hypothetical protein
LLVQRSTFHLYVSFLAFLHLALFFPCLISPNFPPSTEFKSYILILVLWEIIDEAEHKSDVDCLVLDY